MTIVFAFPPQSPQSMGLQPRRIFITSTPTAQDCQNKLYPSMP